MTSSIRSTILLLLVLTLPALTWSQRKQVTIRIGQEESILLDTYESNIVLERKSFKIQVLLDNVAGVYVFAAFHDSLCCRLGEADAIPDFAGLPDRTMREEEYNREKELLVNDDNSCAYWFYDKETAWRGFNKKIILLDSGKIVAVKTIKQVFYVPTQKEMKLKEMNRPLYLFFIAISEFDAAGRPHKELMRRKVRIDWIDED